MIDFAIKLADTHYLSHIPKIEFRKFIITDGPMGPSVFLKGIGISVDKLGGINTAYDFLNEVIYIDL